MCNTMVDMPIESCGAVLCAECLATKIKEDHELACPYCNTDHFKYSTTIRKASRLVLNVLKQVEVKCKSCTSVVQLGNCIPHVDSECAQHVQAPVTIQDVLQKPLDSPLRLAEQQL